MRPVFIIGLSKTGTHSAVKALADMGLRVEHYPKRALLNDPTLGGMDGAGDIPVARDFERLDRMHSKARFVYTIRERESWLRSCQDHFVGRPVSALDPWSRENRVAIYGRARFDRSAWSRAYSDHHERVMRYFAGRPEDLLTVDICGGDPIGPLARFVGRQVADPRAAFPRVYATAKPGPRVDVLCLAPALASDAWSLRYALRSIERNFIDLATVWVAGDRPGWLSPEAHSLPTAGLPLSPLELREHVVLSAAATSEAMRESLLYVGPGQLLLNPWLSSKARRDHLETQPSFAEESWHPRAAELAPLVALTREHLGRGARSYEVPIPRVLERRRLAELMGLHPDLPALCPLWRSAYFKKFPLEPKERAFMPDPKVVIVSDRGPPTETSALLDGVFLYHPPLRAGGRTARLLERLFPTPSRFEAEGAGVQA